MCFFQLCAQPDTWAPAGVPITMTPIATPTASNAMDLRLRMLRLLSSPNIRSIRWTGRTSRAAWQLMEAHVEEGVHPSFGEFSQREATMSR
jgi:hypothetical protein